MTIRYSELLDMGLKLIHIDRGKIDFEARAREFRETVLKPKWDVRSRERAEKLMAKIIRDSKTSTPEFITPKERIVRGEKIIGVK